jgi:hypothetical protein
MPIGSGVRFGVLGVPRVGGLDHRWRFKAVDEHSYVHRQLTNEVPSDLFAGCAYASKREKKTKQLIPTQKQYYNNIGARDCHSHLTTARDVQPSQTRFMRHLVHPKPGKLEQRRSPDKCTTCHAQIFDSGRILKQLLKSCVRDIGVVKPERREVRPLRETFDQNRLLVVRRKPLMIQCGSTSVSRCGDKSLNNAISSGSAGGNWLSNV